ncbi:VOC family protein [Jeotgalibacillus sp. R-1-5s-1]|uniref:VOC family protein n=1 Tax=Jeotgalibacillus sp. R-1-5s-1 TaxID=2555897 RepID=UPI00106D2DBC|nr:VOC family protein [Jeotgalibacillus sp. R-1-5s-1]TFE00805.1 VOC family protein [Jeotgalibacillus sp. R-1-5s-1]
MSLLKRVGTIYLPVQHVRNAAVWYEEILGATINHEDEEKAIVDLADQSFFLVKSLPGETLNFKDYQGHNRFAMTFEVDGLKRLEEFRDLLLKKGVTVGHVENRGHAGRNVVFEDPDGNRFDVWSELSPDFKRRGSRESF